VHHPPELQGVPRAPGRGRPAGTWTFDVREGDATTGSYVNHFLGVRPSDDGDLLSELKTSGRYLPPAVLPIAEDPGGSLICIDGREQAEGPVVFWDSEFSGFGPEEVELFPIAPSFEAFLEGLTEREPQPEPEERPSGWRRLFGRS